MSTGSFVCVVLIGVYNVVAIWRLVGQVQRLTLNEEVYRGEVLKLRAGYERLKGYVLACQEWSAEPLCAEEIDAVFRGDLVDGSPVKRVPGGWEQYERTRA